MRHLQLCLEHAWENNIELIDCAMKTERSELNRRLLDWLLACPPGELRNLAGEEPVPGAVLCQVRARKWAVELDGVLLLAGMLDLCEVCPEALLPDHFIRISNRDGDTLFEVYA